MTHSFTKRFFKRIRISALLLLAVMNQLRHAAAQDIYISTERPLQTIDGVGFCHEGDRQNGNSYVISSNIQQMLDNHMSLFRDMFPNKTWEPAKGAFNYTDVRVINSVLRLKTMQERGIKVILGIWDVPDWLVTNPTARNNRKINNFDDFAAFITSFLVFAKDKYGVNVDYIDVNETRTSGINISMTAEEYILLVQKCDRLFDASEITTKINLGSVLLWDIQYCRDIYNAVKGLRVAGFPSWHTYRGGNTKGREPISLWEEWNDWRKTLDRNLWGTETDYDAFYWLNPERLSWKGVEEMAVMYYRNFVVACLSTSAGWFWHPEWPSHNVHIAYMNHFEPGGQIIEASQPDSNLLTVAYRHLPHRKFVIHILNLSSTDRTVTFHGVPANATLKLIRTSESGDRYAEIGSYAAAGTDLTVSLLGNSFNTYYGDLEAKPAISTSTADARDHLVEPAVKDVGLATRPVTNNPK